MTVKINGDISEYRKHSHFIELTLFKFIFLFLLGLMGGLVSGFIGSGGAFVLTPGMMSLGVDGLVAVASNMCHKFPKAMVGAYKRYKYGHVDLKLGITTGVTAVFGVLVGIRIQQYINELWGDAGSNLYVSLAFVVVLLSVGSYVFLDARKIVKNGGVEKISRLALA
ncbi:MAG: sulfite exporter TauE/SafE family protein, partial [Syntrophaceae bacterium]|nr:sulfite exporter TauE/SafE family protein [Syntrophaceae bacterium]